MDENEVNTALQNKGFDFKFYKNKFWKQAEKERDIWIVLTKNELINIIFDLLNIKEKDEKNSCFNTQ